MEFEYLKVSQATGHELEYLRVGMEVYPGISNHGPGMSQATGMELEYVKVSQAMNVEFESLSLRGWNRFSTEPQMFGGFTGLRKAHLVQLGSLGDQMAIL